MARHAALIQINYNFATTSAVTFAPIGNPNGHIGLSLSEANTRITHRGADMTVRLPKVVVTSNSKSAATTVVWNKNGSPSSCSITIPAGATGEFTGTGSVSYTDGDTYSVTLTPPGTGAFALNLSTLAWDIAATGAAPIIYGSQWAGGSPTGTSLVRTLLGGQLQWGSASFANAMQVAGVFRGLAVYVNVNSNAGATDVSLLVNGSATLTVSIPAGATGRFEDTGTTSISVGDYVEIGAQRASGSGTFSPSQAFVHFTPTTAGEAQILNGFDSSTALSGDGAVYRRLAGDSGFQAQTTESSNQTTAPFAGVASRLSATVQFHVTSTNSTLRLRKNGSNGNSVISIPANTTGRFEDTSNTDTIAAGDLIGYQLTPGTGAGVRAVPSIKFVADQAEPPAILSAAVGSFTLSGQAAGLLSSRKLVAAVGSFSLAGQAATLIYTTTPTLAAAVGSFTLSGQAAGLALTRYLSAAGGTFTLAGQDAALKRSARLTADAGTFTFAGQDASLQYQVPNVVFGGMGSFALAGQAAALIATRKLSADVGTFTTTGFAAGGQFQRTMSAEAADFRLTGQDAGLRYLGVEIVRPTTPGGNGGGRTMSRVEKVRFYRRKYADGRFFDPPPPEPPAAPVVPAQEPVYEMTMAPPMELSRLFSDLYQNGTGSPLVADLAGDDEAILLLVA